MVYIWLYFRRKYLTWEADRGRKNENFCSIGSCGRDRGGWRATGAAGTAAAGRGVLAGWLVRNKSKIMSAPLLLVLFNVRPNLFCTAWEFAPAAGPSG